MGKLSNIFGILALVLAGVAAYFSFTISARRAEFRLRADKESTALVEIVKAVDADSGTSLAGTVSFTPGNPTAGTKESGSLGWDSFHKAKDDSGAYAAFQDLLNQAVAHVNSLAKQRNDLAESLANVSTTMALPEGQLAIADLRNLGDAETFGKATGTVERHIAAVAARDKAVIDALVQAGDAMELPVDRNALTTREQTRDSEDQPVLGDFACDRELSSFTTNVKDLNKRASDYGQTLVDAMDAVKEHKGVFAWSANRDRIQDRNNYEGALTQIANDFGKINEQLDGYVAAKNEIADLNTKVDKLEGDLDEAQKDLTSTQDKLVKAQSRIEYLEKLANVESDSITPEQIAAMAKNIEGQVISVDHEFNYVILNLGANKVKDNMELLVARGDKLVAKVRVAKVLSKISVADILPIAMQDTVKPDDRVILSAIQN